MVLEKTLESSLDKVKVALLCPAICDSMDYTVHGILQARIPEWVAFPFSRGLPHCRQVLFQLSHKGSPTARRSIQSILKEINPEHSMEGLVLNLKLQYFGDLMGRANSLEKTLMLGRIEGGRRRG